MTRLLTQRDVLVAIVAVTATLGVVSARQATPAVMHSTVFDVDSITPRAVEYGSVRSIVRSPTMTLDELEMHYTTLNPGQKSHDPHQHANEELIILREGTLETLSGGVWKRVGPGGIIFNASNELHGVRNIGTGPASYHVINWKSPEAKK
jgi:quercetin dioxygenase-like cupin family protein